MIRYQYRSEMLLLVQNGGGVCFPQVDCVGTGGAPNAGRVAFTDDVIMQQHKRDFSRWVDKVSPAVIALHGLLFWSTELTRLAR